MPSIHNIPQPIYLATSWLINLAEYYQSKALDLINKFDKRNESDFYMKEYNYAME